MALTITNTTLSSTIIKSELETNFADVATKFGNIDDSDIKSGAAIDVDKLSGQYQEVWLALRHSADHYNAAWPAAPADPAAPTTAEVLGVVALPGSDADAAWTVTDISHVCNDTGTAAGSYDLRTGYVNGSGDIIGSGTITTGEAITAVGAGKGVNDRALEGGSVTITQSSTVRLIYLVSAGQGTAVMDDATAGADSQLDITIALRRKIQA